MRVLIFEFSAARCRKHAVGPEAVLSAAVLYALRRGGFIHQTIPPCVTAARFWETASVHARDRFSTCFIIILPLHPLYPFAIPPPNSKPFTLNLCIYIYICVGINLVSPIWYLKLGPFNPYIPPFPCTFACSFPFRSPF